MSVLLLHSDREDALEDLPRSGYKVRLLRPKAESTPNPVSASTSVLVADPTGTARLTLIIAEWDAKKSGDLAIRVTGADVRSVDPATAIDAKRRAIPVVGSTAITLTLGNLTPAQAVQVSAVAGKEAVGSPLVFSVEPQRGSGK